MGSGKRTFSKKIFLEKSPTRHIVKASGKTLRFTYETNVNSLSKEQFDTLLNKSKHLKIYKLFTGLAFS